MGMKNCLVEMRHSEYDQPLLRALIKCRQPEISPATTPFSPFISGYSKPVFFFFSFFFFFFPSFFLITDVFRLTFTVYTRILAALLWPEYYPIFCLRLICGTHHEGLCVSMNQKNMSVLRSKRVTRRYCIHSSSHCVLCYGVYYEKKSQFMGYYFMVKW